MRGAGACRTGRGEGEWHDKKKLLSGSKSNLHASGCMAVASGDKCIMQDVGCSRCSRWIIALQQQLLRKA
jgi:hypothetical protein